MKVAAGGSTRSTLVVPLGLDGKISLAFTLTFRAEDRTLTGAEVSEMRSAAVAAAQKATGAIIRTA
jgi:phenylalanyl-tRNA synthetase beta chain